MPINNRQTVQVIVNEVFKRIVKDSIVEGSIRNQTHFAERIDLGRGHMSSLMSGKADVNVKNLDRALELVGLPISHFFESYTGDSTPGFEDLMKITKAIADKLEVKL